MRIPNVATNGILGRRDHGKKLREAAVNTRTGHLVLAYAAALTGCAVTNTSSYPVLEQTNASDSMMTCSAIAGDFRSASALRTEIMEAHGDVISDAVKNSVWGAVTNPAGAISKGVWTAAGVSKETSEYARASAAAGLRMETLLRYKRDKDCTETPTRDASLTDDQILTLLDELLIQYTAGQIDEKEYLRQRESFLNKMSYLNY